MFKGRSTIPQLNVLHLCNQEMWYTRRKTTVKAISDINFLQLLTCIRSCLPDSTLTQKAIGVSEGICHLARHLSGSKNRTGTFKFVQKILEVLILSDLSSAPYISSVTPSTAFLKCYWHCLDPFTKWSLYLMPKELVRGESTSTPQLLGNKQGDPDLNS